jgi:HSP20 family protein
MNNAEAIDTTIERVELLYQTLTGHRPPPQGDSPYATMPPERSPEEHVEEQIDRLNDSLRQFSHAPEPRPRWIPPLAVWEGPHETVLRLDVPGVRREQVRLSWSAGALEVRGERMPEPNGGNGLQPRYVESSYGTFERVVPVPAGTKPDEVLARFTDGVLEIRVPRPVGRRETRDLHIA